jgi:hypothetical protein
VCVVQRDPIALAQRLEAVAAGQGIEEPERFERAGDAGRAVIDANGREGVPEHREIEVSVVRDEDSVDQQPEHTSSATSANAGALATSASPIPCTAVASAGIERPGRTSRP